MEGAQVPDSKTPLDLYTYDTHAFDLDDYEMKFMAPFCHSFWEVECLAPPRLSIRCPPLLSSLCLSLYAVVASPLVSIPHLLPHLCYKSLPPPLFASPSLCLPLSPSPTQSLPSLSYTVIASPLSSTTCVLPLPLASAPLSIALPPLSIHPLPAVSRLPSSIPSFIQLHSVATAVVATAVVAAAATAVVAVATAVVA